MRIKLIFLLVLLLQSAFHSQATIAADEERNEQRQIIALNQFTTNRGLVTKRTRNGTIIAGYALLFSEPELFIQFISNIYQRTRLININTLREAAANTLRGRRGFRETYQELSPGQVWADMGAGCGYALDDYLNACPNGGSVIAVNLVQPPHLALQNSERSQHILADAQTVDLRSIYPASEIRLITDVYGAASYTEQLDITLNNYANTLSVGGKMFINVDNTFVGSNPTGLFDYLSKNPALQVECLSSSDKFGIAFEITKTRECNNPFAPLKLVSMQAGSPPTRYYLPEMFARVAYLASAQYFATQYFGPELGFVVGMGVAGNIIAQDQGYENLLKYFLF